MVDLYRVFSILAGIPTQVLSKDMTAVDLSDSDKKNYIFFIVMCLWKTILPVYNCDWQMKKKEEIKSAGGQQRFLSLSLLYIYIVCYRY